MAVMSAFSQTIALSRQVPLYLFGFIIAIIIYSLSRILRRSAQRVPDAPWLRISNLPGKAGELEDARLYVKNGHEVICLGYEKYTKKGQNWLMRTPEGFQFVYHPRYIEEVRSAKDTELWNLPANNELVQTRYTMHKNLEYDQYHFNVVSKQLTQSLGPGLPAIVDECFGAFHDLIGEPKEWKSMVMFPVSFNIVTRTANRLLFGADLARNKEFLKLAIEYSDTFFAGANMIRHYPPWTKRLALYLKTGMYSQQTQARKHLYPLLRSRIAAMEKAKREGTYEEFERTKPADTVQWVLDITPPERLHDLNDIMMRLVHILTAAVHTSSVTYLNALYDLAQHPEVHDELREEINNVFASEDGVWKKQGLTKAMKLDSFIKESARFHPFQAGTMDRIAMKDYTLSDGTVVPKGTYMITPSSAANVDTEIWGPDALEFDPWRFQKRRLEKGQETLHSMVQTTPQFTYFGHGRHACPGRFFAVNEIKVLLIYTLTHYDIKFPDNSPKPELMWFSGKSMPDMTAEIMWKVTVFTRKSAHKTGGRASENDDDDQGNGPNYRVVEVDYLDTDELVLNLKGVDVVLSFVLDYENRVQKALINACVLAKVKRFAPSEWVWGNYSGIELFKYKDEIRQYLEHLNAQEIVLEYCLFQPGMFMNYLSFPKPSAKHLHPSPIPVDIQNCKALALEDEEPHVVFTTVQDLARVVALAVEYEQRWPPVGHIQGSRTTIRDLVKLGEKIRGKPFQTYSIPREDVELGKLESPWIPRIIHSSIPPEKVEEMSRQLATNWLLAASRGCVDMSPTWNRLLPEFKPTTVEEFLREHFSAD
ncbi:hypothetical protein AYO21_01388 [Fonsecaea monophora]|uniref:Uncharacterized protein n=1 Tax=Fonsecaea monophora TaxID=254056 RepID=A0A177FM40_9EURO|nr:hypothetical protein AYO21_01388 [Fonsecaea monophora]OAG44392.1 hypothetical protein AYO21_01388 [Fonsecaea monophora]